MRKALIIFTLWRRKLSQPQKTIMSSIGYINVTNLKDAKEYLSTYKLRGSAVKCACGSCRAPEFSCQHPHWTGSNSSPGRSDVLFWFQGQSHQHVHTYIHEHEHDYLRTLISITASGEADQSFHLPA
jgi:hypothetical protein